MTMSSGHLITFAVLLDISEALLWEIGRVINVLNQLPECLIVKCHKRVKLHCISKLRYHSGEEGMVSGEWLTECSLSSTDPLWWKGKNTTEWNLDSFKGTIKKNEEF